MPFEKGRAKTGGRAAGVPNRRTAGFRDRILHSGLSPADFLTQVYRDETQPIGVRVDCARTLCAYLYPKLSNVDIHSRDGQPLLVQVLRFSADAPVEPNKQIAALPMIDLADPATDAAGIIVEATVEAADDDEPEC